LSWLDFSFTLPKYDPPPCTTGLAPTRRRAPVAPSLSDTGPLFWFSKEYDFYRAGIAFIKPMKYLNNNLYFRQGFTSTTFVPLNKMRQFLNKGDTTLS
jgi:hypothetical protein